MGANETPSGRAIVIAGPTASGKSALALALAERIGGVVINADSMQVYRDLRILTARPSDEDMARVPHRLYGYVDAAEPYSVGRWLGDVKVALAEVRVQGRVPVVVGGTGLYIKALTAGLSAMPAVPPDVRQRVRHEAEGRAPRELYAQLKAQDPLTASKLRDTDPQRIIRALEVFAATGRPLASFQQTREAPLLPPSEIAGVFVAPERDLLRRRIEGRFHDMLENGAWTEIEGLALRQLDQTLPAMRALGVPQLLACIRGEADLDSAVARSVSETIQYAKRQVTFARNQLPWLRRVAAEPQLGDLLDAHGA